MKVLDRIEVGNNSSNMLVIDKLEDGQKIYYNINVVDNKTHNYNPKNFIDRLKMCKQVLKNKDIVYTSLNYLDDLDIKILHQKLIEMINKKG